MILIGIPSPWGPPFVWRRHWLSRIFVATTSDVGYFKAYSTLVNGVLLSQSSFSPVNFDFQNSLMLVSMLREFLLHEVSE